MAKVSTSGGWSLSSDANLRIWLTEYIGMLVSAGLVQTADTGQINLSTVTIPGVNQTLIGFFLLRFNDSLQPTAPIYIKISIYRANSAANINFSIEVGTGSDGAGNVTGTKQTISSTGLTGATPGAGTYNSYAIHKEGFAAMVWKLAGTTSSTSFCNPSFLIQRTVDNTGAPTADGVHVLSTSTNLNSTNAYGRCFRLRFLPTTDVGAVYESWMMGFMPGPSTDSRVGLAPQIFTHWVMMPKQRPLLFSAACVRSEVAAGNQFPLKMVGTVARNYICVSDAFNGVMTGSTLVGASGTCMLWED